jgi:hypothetical protein
MLNQMTPPVPLRELRELGQVRAPQTASRTEVRPAVLLACCASGCSGLIHFSVAGQHFDEWVAFGILFVVAATLQFAWAAVAYRRPVRSVLWAGALLNAGIALVWLWSRTLGLPVGPDAGTPEPVGRLDAASTVDEILVAVISCWLASAGRRDAADGSDRTWLIVPLLVINVTVIRAGGSHH